MDIEYSWLPGPLVQNGFLQECSELFSGHYGLWSENSPHAPGQRIRLSAERIRKLLESKESSIAYARQSGRLIGYAISLQSKVPRKGVITWVTQLVVHSDFRRLGVGKTLLFSIWSFSDHYAWGLLSSNPYAVRALEKATRRRCDPGRIARGLQTLLSLGRTSVPYVNDESAARVSRDESIIDTRFFVSHSNIAQKLRDVTKEGVPWLLGDLPDGWEWCAFTFKDQAQIGLSPTEIQEMLEANDQVTRQAYSRMRLDDSHHWAKHSTAETAWIAEYCEVAAGNRVLDVGCGRGRHVLELSARGIDSTGVDYVPEFIASAQRQAAAQGLPARFAQGDARELRLNESFDAVVCLYDVIGSCLSDHDNRQMLDTIHAHLRPGGRALISVMNRHLTETQATQRFSLTAEPDRLLHLRASDVMQSSGNIFDPSYYLVDTDTGVVYRKEQFAGDGSLPIELIVRDRRFYREEIRELCESAELRVLWTRCVQAGRWDRELDCADARAKEILVLCERR